MKILYLALTLLFALQTQADEVPSNVVHIESEYGDDVQSKLGLIFHNYPINSDGTQTYELFVDRLNEDWRMTGIALIYLDESKKKILEVNGMSHCEKENNKCIMNFQILHSELKNTKLRFYYSSIDDSKLHNFRWYDVIGLNVLTRR